MATGNDEPLNKLLAKLTVVQTSDMEEEEPFVIECKPCAKRFFSVDLYEKHIASKKHEKVVSTLMTITELGVDAPKKKSTEDNGISVPIDEFHCEDCDKRVCGLQNYFLHMEGSGHAKSIKMNKLKEEIKVMKGVLLEDDKNDEGWSDGPLKCNICNVQMTSLFNYKQHLLGTMHQKQLNNVKYEKELEGLYKNDVEGNQFTCKECKKSFSHLSSLISHMTNNSHGKQKQKHDMFDLVTLNPEIVVVKKKIYDMSTNGDDNSDEKGELNDWLNYLLCKVCNVTLSGPENAKDHLQGKKHLKIKMENILMKALKEEAKAKE